MTIKATDEFRNFLGTLINELIKMPDEQVLDDIDPSTVQAEGVRLLQAAKVEAGKARLAAAKAGRAAGQTRTVAQVVSVTPEEARQFIAQAANDRRYTLAARSLNDMPDDEALRLYIQLKSLESDPDGTDK